MDKIRTMDTNSTEIEKTNTKYSYLDNAATTPVLKAAADAAARVFCDVFGNPSSLHNIGLEAELLIKQSTKTIADLLKIQPDEIYYTSGGTESNNTAIFGIARAAKKNGRHIITTKSEHPSVLEAVNALLGEDFVIDFADIDENGVVDVGHIKSLVREDTVLCSVHHVNNETGAVQNLAEISNAVKAKNGHVIFHTDSVQGFGKLDIPIKKWGIDVMSISAHKIGGLKGCGALYIRNGVLIKPLFYGGGQQKKIRPGTENTAGIAAFAAASAESFRNMSLSLENAAAIKKEILKILDRFDGVSLNGSVNGSSYITNLSFEGIKSEVLLHALEEKGVYISAGSACSSKAKLSHVILSMGIAKQRAESAIRISLSGHSKMEDAIRLVEALDETVPFLRRHGGVRR